MHHSSIAESKLFFHHGLSLFLWYLSSLVNVCSVCSGCWLIYIVLSCFGMCVGVLFGWVFVFGSLLFLVYLFEDVVFLFVGYLSVVVWSRLVIWLFVSSISGRVLNLVWFVLVHACSLICLGLVSFSLAWFSLIWFCLVLVVLLVKDNSHNWFVCLVVESNAHNLVVWRVKCSPFGCLIDSLSLSVWWSISLLVSYVWLSLPIDSFDWLVIPVWFFWLIVSPLVDTSN